MTDDLTIRPDEIRGHIHYQQNRECRERERTMIATDLGNALHFGGGWLMLTPDQARRVADSLNWWADRHTDPVVELPEGQAELPIGGAS